MLNEGNQIHNFISRSGSGTVINYGSGSDSLTSYQTVPVPLVKKLRFLQFRFRFHNAAIVSSIRDSFSFLSICHTVILNSNSGKFSKTFHRQQLGVYGDFLGVGMEFFFKQHDNFPRLYLAPLKRFSGNRGSTNVSQARNQFLTKWSLRGVNKKFLLFFNNHLGLELSIHRKTIHFWQKCLNSISWHSPFNFLNFALCNVPVCVIQRAERICGPPIRGEPMEPGLHRWYHQYS